MKVVIVGDGWIGNKIYNHLNNQNIRCHVVSKYKFNNARFYWMQDTTHVINARGYTGNPNVAACEATLASKSKTSELNTQYPIDLYNGMCEYGVKFIHISTGCLFQGNKSFPETATPNFGAYTPNSSWYCKTKHMAEIALGEADNLWVLRPRMFVDNVSHPKNLLDKLYKYSIIVDAHNSVTYMPHFCKLIENIVTDKLPSGTYNAVNETIISNEAIIWQFPKGLKRIISQESFNSKQKVRRSFCTLSTNKLGLLGCSLGNLDIEEVVRQWITTL